MRSPGPEDVESAQEAHEEEWSAGSARGRGERRRHMRKRGERKWRESRGERKWREKKREREKSEGSGGAREREKSGVSGGAKRERSESFRKSEKEREKSEGSRGVEISRGARKASERDEEAGRKWEEVTELGSESRSPLVRFKGVCCEAEMNQHSTERYGQARVTPEQEPEIVDVTESATQVNQSRKRCKLCAEGTRGVVEKILVDPF